MPFEFNPFSSLLLVPFVNGLLYAVMLWWRGRRENDLSDRLMAWILLVTAVRVAFWMLGYAGWYDSHDVFTSVMFYFPFNTVIFCGPLLYFYFVSLVNPSFRFSKADRIHLLLPALWLLFVAGKAVLDFTVYYPFPSIPEYQYGTKGSLAEMDKTLFAQLVSYGCFFFYVFLTLKRFKAYREYRMQQFSSQDGISFGWLRGTLYAIVSGAVIMFVFALTDMFRGLSYYQEWFSYLALGILLVYTGIQAFSVTQARRRALHFTPGMEPDQEQLPVLQTNQFDAERIALDTFMQESRIYLDPALSLDQLARAMHTNTSSLSRVINKGAGLNFNDYVNQFRVRAVVHAMDAGDHLEQTFSAIAYDCGFNSKATFNRAFRKVMDQTPQEYIRSKNGIL